MLAVAPSLLRNPASTGHTLTVASTTPCFGPAGSTWPLREALGVTVSALCAPARRRSMCSPHDRARAHVPSRRARSSGAVAPCAPDHPDNIRDMSPAAVRAVDDPPKRDRRRTTHATHPSRRQAGPGASRPPAMPQWAAWCRGTATRGNASLRSRARAFRRASLRNLACLLAGAGPPTVAADRHDVSRALIYLWRNQAHVRRQLTFHGIRKASMPCMALSRTHMRWRCRQAPQRLHPQRLPARRPTHGNSCCSWRGASPVLDCARRNHPASA